MLFGLRNRKRLIARPQRVLGASLSSEAVICIANRGEPKGLAATWCGKWDLNPYVVRHTPLKRACLPIPALPQAITKGGWGFLSYLSAPEGMGWLGRQMRGARFLELYYYIIRGGFCQGLFQNFLQIYFLHFHIFGSPRPCPKKQKPEPAGSYRVFYFFICQRLSSPQTSLM